MNAQQVAHFLNWFEGAFFTDPGLKTDPGTTDTLAFRRDLPEGGAVVCTVDRATVTPQEFRLLDAKGTTRFTLSLSDYRILSGIIWPLHMIATAAARAADISTAHGRSRMG